MRLKKLLLPAVMIALCVTIYYIPEYAPPASTPREEQVIEQSALEVTGDVSGALSGVSIVIDPGHGGYDQGCNWKNQVFEAPLNLAVSMVLREKLESLGAYVVMTRESDDSLVDPDAQGNRKKQDMELRRQVAQDANAQIVLSIHMNSHTNSRYSGPQVFFKNGSTQGQTLSGAIQSSLNALATGSKRAALTGDYFVLGICEAAALVECGFITNAAERTLLITQEYQERLAQAITDGTVAYWNALLTNIS